MAKHAIELLPEIDKKYQEYRELVGEELTKEQALLLLRMDFFEHYALVEWWWDNHRNEPKPPYAGRTIWR